MIKISDQCKKIIERLDLQPHPEGGYFAEVYRSNEKVKERGLPGRYSGERVFSTSIYFLLEGNQVSHMHRLKSDETWHFYLGSTLLLHIINPGGNYSEIKIGNNLEQDEILQFTIPQESWFGAEVMDKESFALVGCTVAPGFEFDDFEMGERNTLLELYPQYKALIEKLTT